MLAIKSIRSVDQASLKAFDLMLCACGYESRARAVAEQLPITARQRLAVGFVSQQSHAYDANQSWFTAHDFLVLHLSDSDFRQAIEDILVESLKENVRVSVGIDISCLNRFRLAQLVDIIRTMQRDEVSVTFFYAIANFTLPTEDSAPTVTVEPVIAQFAGWTTRPDKPPAAVVGLGYETNKAIGVVDHLEINNATWAYYPESPVSEYVASVKTANASLLSLIEVGGRCRPYAVTEPALLFQEMNALVDMLKVNFNPILIPFGPKLFALVSLLVGCVHDDVGIWRVSSGVLERPVDRSFSGHSVALQVEFARK